PSRASPAAAAERALSGVARGPAELLVDAQQAVVLRHAIGAAERAGLDLPRPGRHREVGDGVVLGLARAMGDDAGVPALVREADAVERLGQRADLVQLDEDAVGDALLDALRQPAWVRHEEIVPDE